jgi:glycine cleavage system H protein
MSSPTTLRFSESHEWFKADGATVTLGITKFAADELTDVTYVELKPVGTKLQAGSSVGEVESVKTTSEVFSAVAGEIVEVNAKVTADPSLLNADPFGSGWLVKIRATDTTPLAKLMDQPTYDKRHPVG